MQYGGGSELFFRREIEDLVVADAVLTFAFTFFIIGGASAFSQSITVFFYFLPICFIAVSLTFVLHELMHKFVAQRFGAVAAFKTSTNGLLITILSSMIGILFAIPGATVIYTNRFTKEQEGYVSLAGPLTNFAIFIIFFVIGNLFFRATLHNVVSTLSSDYVQNSYVQNIINMVVFLSIWLAFFNMLPIYPLDGSKVLRWNKGIYILTVLIIFVLLIPILGLTTLLFSLVFVFAIALFFSLIYRGVMLF